jgi:hypothetical protein
LHNVIGNFTRVERELEQARAQDQDLLADWLADPDGNRAQEPSAK